MPIQSNTEPKGLWEKKTYLSAAVSALIAAAVAVSVCAFKGETLAVGHTAPVSVLDTRTTATTGLCLAGGK